MSVLFDYILCISSLPGSFLEPFKRTFCLAGATMMGGTGTLLVLVGLTRFVAEHDCTCTLVASCTFAVNGILGP